MFNETILNSKDTIKEEIKKPYLKLDDALEPEFAKELHKELLSTKLWKEQGDVTMSEKGGQKVHNSFRYSRQGITLGNEDNPEKLLQLHRYLNSPGLLQWMSDVSGRRCDFFEGSATIFTSGDHISRHNDLFNRVTADGVIQSRALTFNYWLTNDWLPEYGGHLVWEKPFAEILPTFNTLVLFSPTQMSQHWVEVVAENVSVPRIAVSGWFMTDRTRDKHKFQLKI